MNDLCRTTTRFPARNVVRGLHYQVPPQGKLVRVVVGEILDVAVDLRRSSPTFGRWKGSNLSEANQTNAVDSARVRSRLPRSVGEWLTSSTKPPSFYDPEAERTIAWNDPVLEDRLAACRSSDYLRQEIVWARLFERLKYLTRTPRAAGDQVAGTVFEEIGMIRSRRDFLRSLGVGAAAGVAVRWPLEAVPRLTPPSRAGPGSRLDSSSWTAMRMPTVRLPRWPMRSVPLPAR